MPLFGRPDGDAIAGLPPVRAIIPYIMKGRNESIVFYETLFDLSKTLPWLEKFNKSRRENERATVFHLCIWACAQVLHRRPGLNRFVSGASIYQRNNVSISFVAKKALSEDAPIATIKVVIPESEPFGDFVTRLRSLIGEGRTGPERPVDKEVRIVTKLPSFILSFATCLLRWLDRHNLMPASMILPDPMYASLFIANVGSLGIDSAFHHLYEWGNVSVFGVVGKVQKHLFVTDDGKTEVKDGLQIRWSFDERINDGFYCARSLDIGRKIVEDPAAHAEMA